MKILSSFVMMTLLLLVSIALTTATSFTSAAMHEDEAGKYDWVSKHVGSPTSASLFISASKKSAFVATEANTIASLKLKNGAINWRRVFGKDDEFVCVAPVETQGGSNSVVTVVAVTKTGVVHFLRAKDGANVGFPFSLTNENTNIFSCVNAISPEDNSVYIMGSVEKTLSMYRADLSVPDQPRVSPLGHITTPARAIGVAAATPSAGSTNTDIKAGDEEILVVLEDGSYSWAQLKQRGSLREFKKGASALSVPITSSSVIRSIHTEGKISRRQALLTVAADQESSKNNNNQEFISADCSSTPGVLTKNGGSNVVVTCSSSSGTATVAGVSVPSISCDKTADAFQTLAISESVGEDSSTSYRILFTSSVDGSLHFVAVNLQKKSVTTTWSLNEGLANPRDVALESAAVASSSSGSSKFAIATSVFVLSRYNILYKLSRGQQQQSVDVNFATNLVVDKKAASVYSGSIVKVDEENGNIFVKLGMKKLSDNTYFQRFITVDENTGAILTSEDKTSETARAPGNYYEICRCKGLLLGFEILADGSRVDTWKVRIQGKIASVLSEHDLLAISSVEHYRSVPNRTSQTTEIRRRFPMANVIVVAFHDALGALVVAAVDSLTGTTLASSRHPDCPGDVRLVIAEHTIIYHFFNRAKRRYYVATWELFEHQTQVLLESNMVSPALVAQSLVAKRRQFHSAQVRAPHVVSSIKNYPHGPVSLMGVTSTGQSIARKLVVFVQPNGEVLSAPLPAFWGIPLKQPEPKTEQEVQMANTIAIPYFERLTTLNRVAQPALFRSAPTKLESTSRIIVAGLDLFYIPTSAGKPFDRLDDEFNKQGLLMVCCLLPVLALVLRYFAIRRSVNVAWS